MVFVLIMASHTGTSMAMKYSLKPRGGSNVTYSDNIDGTATDETSDFYFSPFFGLDFSAESKTLSYNISTNFGGRFYVKNDQNSDFNIPGVNGNLTYRFSKRLEFRSSSFFRYVPNDSSFQEPVFQQDSGTGEAITTFITGRTDRLDFSIDPALSYKLTRMLTSTVGVGYSTLQFSNNPNSDLNDSNTYSGFVQNDYTFTRNFTGGITLSYSKTDFVQEGPAIDNDTEVYQAVLTSSYQYLEHAILNLSVGAARSKEKTQASETNFIGSASTNIDFKTYSVFVGISSDVSGNRSELGNATENQSLRASFSTNPTKKSDLTIAGGLTRQRSIFTETENLLIGSLSVRLGYDLLKNVSIFLSGSSSKQDARGGQVNDIEINMVTIGFSMGHTISKEKVLEGS